VPKCHCIIHNRTIQNNIESIVTSIIKGMAHTTYYNMVNIDSTPTSIYEGC